MDSLGIGPRLSQLENEMAIFMGQLTELKGVNSVSAKVCTKSTEVDRLEVLEKSFLTFSNKVFSFLGAIRTSLARQEVKLDEMEQYSRRNCLLVHGVEEKPGENLVETVQGLFKNKLEVNVDPRDFDRLHRIGKVKTSMEGDKNMVRPIIVKFTSYSVRNTVFTNKKKLKGSKDGITESLTSTRFSLLRKVKETFDKSNVWTYDGRIVVLNNNQKHYLSTEDDLNILFKKVPVAGTSNFVTHRRKN